MTTQTQQTYYHVAGAEWVVGEPLLCRDRLVALGVDIAWKWDDAPEGFDGDVVCLFDNYDEAAEFRAEFGGELVAVTIPEDMDDSYALPWGGYISPRMTQVDEGYTAIADGIPSEWITLIA